MNTPTDPKNSPIPKFPDFESLVKELVCLRIIQDATIKRIEEILTALKDGRLQLDCVLSSDFSPPPSGDADMQKCMTSLGALVKSSGPLGNQTIGNGKASAGTVGTTGGK